MIVFFRGRGLRCCAGAASRPAASAPSLRRGDVRVERPVVQNAARRVFALREARLPPAICDRRLRWLPACPSSVTRRRRPPRGRARPPRPEPTPRISTSALRVRARRGVAPRERERSRAASASFAAPPYAPRLVERLPAAPSISGARPRFSARRSALVARSRARPRARPPTPRAQRVDAEPGTGGPPTRLWRCSRLLVSRLVRGREVLERERLARFAGGEERVRERLRRAPARARVEESSLSTRSIASGGRPSNRSLTTRSYGRFGAPTGYPPSRAASAAAPSDPHVLKILCSCSSTTTREERRARAAPPRDTPRPAHVNLRAVPLRTQQELRRAVPQRDHAAGHRLAPRRSSRNPVPGCPPPVRVLARPDAASRLLRVGVASDDLARITARRRRARTTRRWRPGRCSP